MGGVAAEGWRGVGCEGGQVPPLQGPRSVSHIKECGPCSKRKGKPLKGWKQKMGQIRVACLKASLAFLAAIEHIGEAQGNKNNFTFKVSLGEGGREEQWVGVKLPAMYLLCFSCDVNLSLLRCLNTWSFLSPWINYSTSK